jgi:hypothetical protein
MGTVRNRCDRCGGVFECEEDGGHPEFLKYEWGWWPVCAECRGEMGSEERSRLHMKWYMRARRGRRRVRGVVVAGDGVVVGVWMTMGNYGRKVKLCARRGCVGQLEHVAYAMMGADNVERYGRGGRMRREMTLHPRQYAEFVVGEEAWQRFVRSGALVGVEAVEREVFGEGEAEAASTQGSGSGRGRTPGVLPRARRVCGGTRAGTCGRSGKLGVGGVTSRSARVRATRRS